MGYWKKKPLDTRFKDTYDFIQSQMATVPQLDLVTFQLDARLRALDDAGQLAPLIKEMSLGFRWEIGKSGAETRRRHYIRAVLMAYAALGDPDQKGKRLELADVKAKKPATEKLGEAQLDALLRRMLQIAMQTEGARSFVGFDTTLEKQNAIWALDRISEATTRVQMALGTVPRVPEATQLFRTWFGNTTPRTIHGNFSRIHAGIQAGVVLIKDPDPAKNNVFGYVYPDGPNNPPRIYLCNAFWRAGRVSWQNKGGIVARKDGREADDNPLGVLLHELSHIFCRTQDHQYGKSGCRALATNSPNLAANNADNHEYYAEEVMRRQW